jgi:hypothetical protein
MTSSNEQVKVVQCHIGLLGAVEEVLSQLVCSHRQAEEEMGGQK